MRIVEIDLASTAQREGYDRLFEDCPDAFIQQSSFWADCIAPLGPDRPIFLLCRDGERDIAGLPLYLFEAESGNILTSVPQPGPMGGVFSQPGLSDEQIDEAYRLLIGRAIEIAEQHRCISLSIISNPFKNDVAKYEKHLEPTHVFENFTQYAPLDRPIQCSAGQRDNLRKARKFGYTAVSCESHECFLSWLGLHRQRFAEIDAQPLDGSLLENLFCRLVPLRKASLMLLMDGATIASGALYVKHRNIMDVFAISLNSAYSRQGANAANTDASIEWAKQEGCGIYNWQSSPSRDSGVYTYKRHWGSIEAPYYFLTKLFCPEERLRALGADRIRQEYVGHYVVPFGLFTSAPGTRRFYKT